jgi:manganese/zinc/iron transport system permease protein
MIDELARALPLSYTEAIVAIGSAAIGMLAGMVGCTAVLRRRAMVGDAMSHAALPGVCVAFLLTGSKAPHVLLAGALVAGLLAAFVVVLLDRSRAVPVDAAIGVVLSVSFSVGIVLLALIARRPDADQAGLERYLFGQAASLLTEDVRAILVLLATSLLVLVVLRHAIVATLFDRGFAASSGLRATGIDVAMTALLVVAAVTGLQVVGAILMVALLVAPAVTARQFTASLRTMVPLAGLVGAVVGGAGALVSARSALPTGPVIVLLATGVAALAIAFAPRRGIVAQARLRRRVGASPSGGGAA